MLLEICPADQTSAIQEFKGGIKAKQLKITMRENTEFV